MKASTKLLSSIAEVLSNAPRLDLMHRGVLIANLVFMYHTMRASEDLLSSAVQYASGDLKSYFLEHLEEERGHADWLASDLICSGIDPKATPIPRQAVELVGSQMYLMKYLHPATLLGYMALLECFPMPLAHLEALEKQHGTELLRTLRFHAEHDREHGADVRDMVDKLTPREQAIAIESGRQAALYFAGVMFALATPNEGLNG